MHLRNDVRWVMRLVDTMISDGLWDAFNGYHMGNTGRHRPALADHARAAGRFAAASQARRKLPAGRAWGTRSSGYHRGARGGAIVDTDDTSTAAVEVLSKLRPAFDKNGRSPRQRLRHQ
jgi:acetyl-CoA C-acetyltransferase